MEEWRNGGMEESLGWVCPHFLISSFPHFLSVLLAAGDAFPVIRAEWEGRETGFVG
jgi:hypothetical protein